MEQITGLHHIGIYTDHMEESIQFYEAVLGFRTLFVTGGSERIAMLERGGIRVELVSELGSTGRAAACMNHLSLSCSDVDACAAQLTEKGILFESGSPQQIDGFGIPPADISVLFFRGPSGERIELYQIRS